jgi:hypothetical protein
MREINTFDELYNTSILIIENTNNTFADYSVIEIINYIRINSGKELLNSFYILGDIPQYVADEIQSKTTVIKFSVDSLIKNILEHPELTLNEYKNLSKYINKAEYILLKNNKNLIYFKIDNTIYQFVIKKTQNSEELFVTTFHKASINQLNKDIKRYKQIKR